MAGLKLKAGLAVLALGAVAVLAVALVTSQPNLPPDLALKATPQPHHTATGFKNNYVESINRPFSDLLRWRWAAWKADLPPAARNRTPVQAPDLAFLNGNRGLHMQPSVTWIGHATALVQTNGLNVLTDPIFSNRASAVQWIGPQRAQPPGILLQNLPPIDVVVISYNHYDHLDKDSVLALDARSKAASANGGGQTLFLVPLGQKAWFNALGIHRVVELDWWQGVRVVRGPGVGAARGAAGDPAGGALQISALHFAPPTANVTAEAPTSVINAPSGLNAINPSTTPPIAEVGADFYLTPVQHWSARSINDRSRTLWGGWSVLSPQLNWYFSGDTGYSPDFADTRRRLGPLAPTQAGKPKAPLFDLALLAVGAYAPRWFMAQQHVNPAEAVQIHQDLGAALSVGIHWGTFELTDEPLDQPPRDLALARQAAGVADAAFVTLQIGETRKLAPRVQHADKTPLTPPIVLYK